MSVKKILKELSPEEIDNAFVLLEELSAQEQVAADKELAERRKARRTAKTPAQLRSQKLLQLKFQLEDYLSNAEKYIIVNQSSLKLKSQTYFEPN